MEDLKETVTRLIEFQLDQQKLQLDQQKRVDEMFLLQQQKADERMQKTESLLQALISRDQTLRKQRSFLTECSSKYYKWFYLLPWVKSNICHVLQKVRRSI